MENAARLILSPKEDQLLIVDLGGNKEASRELATVLGQSLPDAESGMGLICRPQTARHCGAKASEFGESG
jgi:hypothetical protein